MLMVLHLVLQLVLHLLFHWLLHMALDLVEVECAWLAEIPQE